MVVHLIIKLIHILVEAQVVEEELVVGEPLVGHQQVDLLQLDQHL